MNDEDDRKTLKSPPPDDCEEDDMTLWPDDAPECSPPASGVYRIRGS